MYPNEKITSKLYPNLTPSIFTLLKIWREFKVVTKYLNWQSPPQDAKRVTHWENICHSNCDLKGNVSESTWAKYKKNAECLLYTSKD